MSQPSAPNPTYTAHIPLISHLPAYENNKKWSKNTDRETECAMGTGGRRGRNADGRELL